MKIQQGRNTCFFWLLLCLFHASLASKTLPKKSKSSTQKKTKPNILFIFADDLGYSDVGYSGRLHGSQVKTPNIDKLASKGVILSNYYVQHLCTPTRSQLMTGRYQIHTGLQHSNIPPTRPYCLPLDEVTLPEKLREAGYATHMVGKWHLGFQKPECLPTNRGFDTFLGLYLGSGNYFTHIKQWRAGSVHIQGYDFHRDTRTNRTVGYKYSGEYSTHTFSTRAQNIIKQHRKKKKPLFMYLSFQAPHGPLQVPSRYKIPLADTGMRGHRKTLAAMIYCMDEAIGNIVQELRDSGLYKNTIIIFSTDNGGAKEVPASNWPHRGSKGTFWEGGLHGVGFINSPLLPKKVRGTTSKAFIHVSDWFPTIVSSLAGGNLNGTKPLDGYNVWDAIISGSPSPRTEILHNINPRKAKPVRSNLTSPFNTATQAAMRTGDWKILTGIQGESKWTAPPESDFESTELLEPADKQVWLFNISADPNEQQDLSESNPSVVDQMLKRLQMYSETMVTPLWPKMDNTYDPSNFGNVWGPWNPGPEPTKKPKIKKPKKEKKPKTKKTPKKTGKDVEKPNKKKSHKKNEKSQTQHGNSQTQNENSQKQENSQTQNENSQTQNENSQTQNENSQTQNENSNSQQEILPKQKKKLSKQKEVSRNQTKKSQKQKEKLQRQTEDSETSTSSENSQKNAKEAQKKKTSSKKKSKSPKATKESLKEKGKKKTLKKNSKISKESLKKKAKSKKAKKKKQKVKTPKVSTRSVI